MPIAARHSDRNRDVGAARPKYLSYDHATYMYDRVTETLSVVDRFTVEGEDALAFLAPRHNGGRPSGASRWPPAVFDPLFEQVRLALADELGQPPSQHQVREAMEAWRGEPLSVSTFRRRVGQKWKTPFCPKTSFWQTTKNGTCESPLTCQKTSSSP